MQQQRVYTPASSVGVAHTGQTTTRYDRGIMDWSSEITQPNTHVRPSMDEDRMASAVPRTQALQMQNGLSDDAVEAPVTTEEVYAGSTKAMLRRNLGNYVVATFLIGTQNTVSWEGVLYDVGNDYVTIYQPGRDRYIVNDIYSLKYTEFYDVRHRQLCDRLMQEQGWDVEASWPPTR